MKTYDHIVRFSLLVIAVIVGFFIIRAYMLPESFGTHGSYSYAYYRAESVNEQAALPAIHQGTEHCSACHVPQAALLAADSHANVNCESCHGSFKAHNNNTMDRMAIADTTEACLVCHLRLAARPGAFPQIDNFAAHLADQGETLTPDMSCSDCHDPHAPM